MNKTSFYFIVLITLNLVLSVSAQANTQNTQNKCGENCHWSIEQNTLKFTGNGKMKDFYSDAEIPWKSQLQQITKISISGISSIGQKAFQNMKELKTSILHFNKILMNKIFFIDKMCSISQNMNEKNLWKFQ